MYVCMYVCMYVYMPVIFIIDNNVQQIRITLDDTGVYMYVESSDGTKVIFYLYYNNGLDLIGEVQLNGFATTSPGTQPLPESM